MDKFYSKGYMSPVWPAIDARSVISLAMFCPHMVLLGDIVIWIRQELALYVGKQNRE